MMLIPLAVFVIIILMYVGDIIYTKFNYNHMKRYEKLNNLLKTYEDKVVYDVKVTTIEYDDYGEPQKTRKHFIIYCKRDTRFKSNDDLHHHTRQCYKVNWREIK